MSEKKYLSFTGYESNKRITEHPFPPLAHANIPQRYQDSKRVSMELLN
jgi:hypothetical protein